MRATISYSFSLLILLIPTIATQKSPVYGEDFKKQYEDCFLETPQLIPKHGYPFEGHSVTTDDGYILPLHRIPYKETCGPKKGTVIIIHGCWETSSIWLIQGPGRSLPYLLADECYDVWLPNLRGNYYAMSHQTLTNKDRKFWDFTVQEIAIYDVPATMKYITEVTGDEKFFCMALDITTTVLYVLLSEKPEYNDKVRLLVSFGPTGAMANAIYSYKPFFFGIHYIRTLTRLLGINDIGPKTKLNYIFAEKFCQPNTKRQSICNFVLLYIAGYDYEQVNKTLMPTYACHFPAGVGRDVNFQFGQSVRYGEFRKFDYGFLRNKKMYGTFTPPKYNWTKITAPSIFYQGDRDIWTVPKDSRIIYDQLPNGVEYKMFHTFIAQDFVVGVDSTEKAYKPLLEDMKRF